MHLVLSLLLAWTPPVTGEPSKLYQLGPDPFARGQHRGVDFAVRGPVRAACAGRVVFAGRVAGAGTVSVRCGRWRVSYAPLARVSVREGEPVGAGARLGRTSRGIHFGVRREGERFGYVDPLRFLGTGSSPPTVAPPTGRPHARLPGPPPLPVAPPASAPVAAQPPLAPRPLAARPRAASSAAPTLAPWPVWVGLTLGLIGLVGAGRLRLPFRRPGGAPCRASSTSSCSPTTPSSP
jgi:hypothetical protein